MNRWLIQEPITRVAGLAGYIDELVMRGRKAHVSHVVAFVIRLVVYMQVGCTFRCPLLTSLAAVSLNCWTESFNVLRALQNIYHPLKSNGRKIHDILL